MILTVAFWNPVPRSSPRACLGPEARRPDARTELGFYVASERFTHDFEYACDLSRYVDVEATAG